MKINCSPGHKVYNSSHNVALRWSAVLYLICIAQQKPNTSSHPGLPPSQKL